MKATDLNQAFNYVDCVYLLEVDTLEKEYDTMKNKKRIRYIYIAAALICLLSITAYAAELLNIHSYQSANSKGYKEYSEIDQALAQAGFQADVPERLSNDFRFHSAKVQDYHAMDENGEQVLTTKTLYVYYRNDLGQNITLLLEENIEGLLKDERTPTDQKTVGEVELCYYRDIYRFVPEDYQLSEEEQEWANQPGHYVSFGADQVQEQNVSFLSWTVNGINYSIMDWSMVEPTVLFEMAEQML